MDKKIDEILENFYLGKIDLIEVRKQLLILYGNMLPKGTLCVCDKPKPFPLQNLTDFFCTKCGREIKYNKYKFKEYKTYDNTILVEGKKYRWSGYCESGLYTSTKWTNIKCKIRKIDGDRIYIYDYNDNKEWDFTNEELRKKNVTFKKLFFLIYKNKN